MFQSLQISWLPGLDFLRSARMYQRNYGLCAGVTIAKKLREAAYGRGEPAEVRINVPTVVSPIVLRARTSDAQVFRQIYGVRELECLLQSAGSPEFIIDAGANTGLTSVLFANAFPKATIIALEIEDSNYATLLKNVASYPN